MSAQILPRAEVYKIDGKPYKQVDPHMDPIVSSVADNGIVTMCDGTELDLSRITEFENPQNWYFTFGHGQEHYGYYVKLHGTQGNTRSIMFNTFGRKWSMQYQESQALPAIEEWNWKELKIG